MEAFTRHLKNPLGGLSQLLEKLNLPQFDAASIVEARRRDIEAVMEANRIVYNGAQALAQKQMEILRTTMSAAREHANAGAFSGTPLEIAARQRELMTKAFQMALGHMRELADIVRNAQSDAFAVVKEQVAADLRELVGKVQGRGKAGAAAMHAASATPAKATAATGAAEAKAKEPSAKQPAAKKPAAKTRAASKPAAKTAPAKPLAVKRTAAKKPTAKNTTGKKPTAKKAATPQSAPAASAAPVPAPQASAAAGPAKPRSRRRRKAESA